MWSSCSRQGVGLIDKNMTGKRSWACELPESERILESLATKLQAELRRLKIRDTKIKAVNRFLKGYFALGSKEDITDTIIRDKVWVFLLKETRRLLTEDVLDEMWETEERKQERLCKLM